MVYQKSEQNCLSTLTCIAVQVDVFFEYTNQEWGNGKEILLNTNFVSKCVMIKKFHEAFILDRKH